MLTLIKHRTGTAKYAYLACFELVMRLLQALVVVLQCYYIAIQYPTQALIITLKT